MDEFLSSCRVCLSQNFDLNIEIFSDYGQSLNICDIINKHLWFTVNIEDGLSHNVCTTCWFKIRDFNIFYTQVYQKHNAISSTFVNSLKIEPVAVLINDEFSDNFIDNDYDENDSETTEVDEKQIIDSEAIITTEQVENVKLEEITNVYEHFDVEQIATNRFPIVKLKRFATSAECSSDASKKKRKRRTKQEIYGDDIMAKKLSKERRVEAQQRKDQLQKELEEIEKTFKMDCDLCKEEIYPIQSLNHAIEHFKETHKCNGYLVCCDKKFFKQYQVREHLEWHRNPDDFKCKLCSKMYFHKDQLKRHIEGVHVPNETKNVQCSQCPKRFRNEIQMKKHEAIHGERKFSCELCPMKFAQKYCLWNHTKMVHELTRRDHICDSCGKQFKTKSAMEIHHSRFHQAPQKVQCHLCGRWLKHLENYKFHMKRHEEAKMNITCDICGRRHTSINAMKEHKRTVHSDNRFKCSFCDKNYSKLRYVREHEATHTGVDLYECEFCGESFKARALYYSHRKNAHYDKYVEIQNNFSYNKPE